MNRFALSFSLLAFASVVSRAQAAPVFHPTTHEAQQVLDRLVKEPLKFEGASGLPLGFRQASGYQGRQPTRVLIGYHLNGKQISGEFVALDAENRPLQAASLSGRLLDSGRVEGPVSCQVDIDLPSTLHLSGLCGPAQISGAYTEQTPEAPLVFLLPGLGESEGAAGEYRMMSWRG